MNRSSNIEKLKADRIWDILVIGGGATGLGIAVDAVTRGYSIALVEKDDFAKGTSSRSTKLVHGGVRYLAQGNLKLVQEALKERGILLRNAPHLTRKQAFIVPSFNIINKYYYGLGLGIYDLLAGKRQIGKVSILSKSEVVKRMPMVQQKKLDGGVQYYDGQFDDARLAVNLAQTAAFYGACMVNHVEVDDLLTDGKKINGALLFDHLTGDSFEVKAKVVINATGVFADGVIQMDNKDASPILSPSQGVHLVVDSKFFPGATALMIPKTDDDRVLFAVPWHDKVVLGTTDTPVDEVDEEPKALDEEIDFIISHFSRYSSSTITRADVLSVFAGLRPLVRSSNSTSTALISRDHTIVVSPSGLITIIGGKWTTYRKMAKDAVENAAFVGKLSKRECVTEDLRIHGWKEPSNDDGSLSIYGSDAAYIRALMESDSSLKETIHPRSNYTKAEVIWAVRNEMAMTVEDVLARRLRLLFLDAVAAKESAQLVAEIMAAELGMDDLWVRKQVEAFNTVATGYILL
jgi:glycerol-3-phosphate dehydrogenase